MKGFLSIPQPGARREATGKMAVSATPFFLSSPVGSFEAREVRFYCDHTIAVHLQSAEDVLIILIAEPRNQKINSITDPTSRERGRGSQTPSGERTEAAVRIIMVKHLSSENS